MPDTDSEDGTVLILSFRVRIQQVQLRHATNHIKDRFGHGSGPKGRPARINRPVGCQL